MTNDNIVCKRTECRKVLFIDLPKYAVNAFWIDVFPGFFQCSVKPSQKILALAGCEALFYQFDIPENVNKSYDRPYEGGATLSDIWVS